MGRTKSKRTLNGYGKHGIASRRNCIPRAPENYGKTSGALEVNVPCPAIDRGSARAGGAIVRDDVELHVEKHRLVVALEPQVEPVDRLAGFTHRGQRGAAVGRH